MRQIYNEYGKMVDEETDRVSRQIENLARILFHGLLKAGCGPDSIRLAAQHLSEGVFVTMSECVLRYAMDKRKAERKNDRIQTPPT